MAVEACASVDEYLQTQALTALGLSQEGQQAIHDYFTPTVFDLGHLVVGDSKLSVSVAHTGTGVDWYKGGTGEKNGRTPDELSIVMAGKVAEWAQTDHTGRLLGGNKIMIDGITRLATEDEQITAFEELAVLMHTHGLARRTSTAGDMGTNNPKLMDAYVRKLRELDPEFAYWQMGATGTSEEYGGNTYRRSATGRGVAQAARFARTAYKELHGATLAKPARATQEARAKSNKASNVSLIGFGNVGGWALADLSEDNNFRITGIRDIGGTLRLADASQPGMIITKEMAEEIADNQGLPRGTNKMALLKKAIEANQPGIQLVIDDMDILEVPADIHLPCAGKETITIDNVKTMQASIIVPGANIPYTLEAWQWLNDPARALEGKPRLAVLDSTGNGAGVAASSVELRAKGAHADRGTKMPSGRKVGKLTTQAASRMYEAIVAMSQEIGTTDLGVSAKALGYARVAKHLGIELDKRFADIVEAQTASNGLRLVMRGRRLAAKLRQLRPVF